MTPPTSNREPYTFDRVIRIIFSTVGIVAIIFLLNYLKGALIPFFVACLIAYMLEPVVRWNKRWTRIRGRFIPVVLTLLETCAAIGIFLALFVPYFISETSAMADILKKYAATQIDIPYISHNIHDFIRDNVDFNTLTRYLSKDEWSTLAKDALASGWSFLSSSVAFVVGAVSWLVVLL